MFFMVSFVMMGFLAPMSSRTRLTYPQSQQRLVSLTETALKISMPMCDGTTATERFYAEIVLIYFIKI